MVAARTALDALGAVALTMVLVSCGGGASGGNGGAAGGGGQTVINVTGSDTMVNLAQAWAETYSTQHPDVSVQVAGGGSGVGIAQLIDGIVDVANASREMKEKELTKARQRNGTDPVSFVVALDALAVYVNKDNPIDTIAIDQLAEIYGDGGTIETWSALGSANTRCTSDEIVRISRQNNSGTYYYFRDAVVGEGRDLKLGALAPSGSKDVVAYVSQTPCAIGYSGMAYATPGVKMLSVSKTSGDPAISPSKETAASGAYPIARPLVIYTKGEPEGALKAYIDWIMSPEGQRIVEEIGYVPVAPTG